MLWRPCGPASYFNSRPREGANCSAILRQWRCHISIPAPARGRTRSQFYERDRRRKFQFPPPRGGEHTHVPAWGRVEHFNSRPREGANYPGWLPADSADISIPAPARGRTISARGRTPHGEHFNSRPREGANGHTAHQTASGRYFNSRPREGANCKTVQNRAVYLVSLLKFGRISAILPYILSATRAKKRETPKIIGFLLRRPTGRSCTEQVGAGGVR